jgi:uncharacterized protein (DUF488 family)
MTPRLAFTIGYEHADEATFVDTLREHGIKAVVDTRANPTSRRPEYRQRRLQETLLSAQIRYYWEPSLGVPKRYRPLAMINRGSFVAQYRRLLRQADDALGRVADLTGSDEIALLCFEADERQCHRLPLADELARRAPLAFRHLRVRRGNDPDDKPVTPTMVGAQEEMQVTGR